MRARMYAQNCWYVAGWDQDVAGGKLHAIRIAGEALVICRRREGDDLRCMYHGFKSAPSGRCIEIPGESTIPEIARVRSYPVESRHGQLDYAAPYRIINDNLLDFSHLPYVHRNSFGAGPEFAVERPRITRLARGVRIDRWMRQRLYSHDFVAID